MVHRAVYPRHPVWRFLYLVIMAALTAVLGGIAMIAALALGMALLVAIITLVVSLH